MKTITETPGALRFIERAVQIGSDIHLKRILQQEWLAEEYEPERGRVTREWRDVPLAQEDKKDS